MLQSLDEFKDIIKIISIERYEASGDNIKLRLKLLLVDNSRLFVRETIISGKIVTGEMNHPIFLDGRMDDFPEISKRLERMYESTGKNNWESVF